MFKTTETAGAGAQPRIKTIVSMTRQYTTTENTDTTCKMADTGGEHTQRTKSTHTHTTKSKTIRTPTQLV